MCLFLNKFLWLGLFWIIRDAAYDLLLQIDL